MKDRGLFIKLAEIFEKKFGPIDLASPWMDFDYTDYYTMEMGSPLFRRMTAFERLVPQDSLPDIKIFTNQVESRFSTNGRRRINIDPGFLSHERFVLATGKNFTHRIYLGKGIYADLTLVFSKGVFQDLEWTYPDYRSEAVKNFLYLVRKKYITDQKG